jgi:hypothetical protein
MQIGAQGIKNTDVTSIIHDYDVEKQRTPPQKKEKKKKEKKNLSIPFKPNSQIKIYFHKRRKIKPKLSLKP